MDRVGDRWLHEFFEITPSVIGPHGPDGPEHVIAGEIKAYTSPVPLDQMDRNLDQIHDTMNPAIVMEFEERAAIIEYDGGISRAEAERLAWEQVRGRS